MNIHEFVLNLFNACQEGATPMDIETARNDIDNFRREGWELPEDITPEAYMSVWNDLCKQ